MSDRTIGILGLGIFGSSVLMALAKQDMNIIAIDDHAERINQFEPVLARGVVGDITDEELLRTAGIDTCDTVVVATGENLESSVLAVMHCCLLYTSSIRGEALDVNYEGFLKAIENWHAEKANYVSKKKGGTSKEFTGYYEVLINSKFTYVGDVYKRQL